MKLLALEKDLPGVDARAFAPLLRPEARRVWELYQQGAVREAYFHKELHTVVLILECEDVQEARQVLASLPLVSAGLIEFELIPLIPYDGFARLFT